MARYNFGVGSSEEIKVDRGEADIKPVQPGAPADESAKKPSASTGQGQSTTPATPAEQAESPAASPVTKDPFSALDEAASSGVRPVEDMKNVPDVVKEIASGYVPTNQQTQETSSQSSTQTQAGTQVEERPQSNEAEGVIPKDVPILYRKKEEEDREEA